MDAIATVTGNASDLPPGLAAEGPAFPILVKVLASLLMAALVYWGLRTAGELAAVAWTGGALTFLALALVMIAVCYYWILRSRTCITETHIRQTWAWRKEVALADVAHIKMVFVPYLDWLIAPRVAVRVRGRGMVVFHASDRRLLQAFAVLSLRALQMPLAR